MYDVCMMYMSSAAAVCIRLFVRFLTSQIGRGGNGVGRTGGRTGRGDGRMGAGKKRTKRTKAPWKEREGEGAPELWVQLRSVDSGLARGTRTPSPPPLTQPPFPHVRRAS